MNVSDDEIVEWLSVQENPTLDEAVAHFQVSEDHIIDAMFRSLRASYVE